MIESVEGRPVGDEEGLYRRFFDLSPLPTAIHDGKTVLFVSPAAVAVFGYETAGEAIGISVDRLVHPDCLPIVAERTIAVLRGERVPARAELFVRKDGSVFEGEAFASLTTYEGKPAILVFIRDLTEIRAAEAGLHRSETNYRQLFELLPDPAVLHDGGVPLVINGAAKELLALGDHPDMTTNIWSVLASDERALLAARMEEMLRTGQPSEPRTVQLRALNGEIKEVELRGSAVMWEDSPAILSVFRDLTERKRVESELRDAESRFSAVVEQAPIAMHFYQLDSDDRLIFIAGNKASVDALGIAPEPLVGLEISEAWPGLADSDIPSTNRAIALHGGLDVRTMEFKQGDVDAMFETHVFPFGERGCVAMFIDVTERIRNEEELDQYRHRLEELVAERTRELDQAHRDVEAITSVAASAVELRDPYTAGHQRRVAQLARAIAVQLELPDETCEHIRIAALLHDIGKLSVPTEILSKPGKLRPVEYELAKGHVQAAEEMLKRVDVDWPLAEMVMQHHERMDGSGYPQGLSGDEIILEARIMAVADVVEAMSSHRPYRAALGIDAAIAEIEANRERLYDADVVDACVAVLGSGFEFELQS